MDQNSVENPEQPSLDWDGFVTEHGPAVRRSVWRHLVRWRLPAQPEDVEDMTQETFCRLLERGRLSEVTRHGEPQRTLCYLRRVACSVVADHGRFRRAVKRGGQCLHVAPEPTRLVSGEPTPEEALVQAESVERARRRLRRLIQGPHSGRDCRVVELAFLEGRSAAEIAECLGGTLCTTSIHGILHRVRRRLCGLGPCVVTGVRQRRPGRRPPAGPGAGSGRPMGKGPTIGR